MILFTDGIDAYSTLSDMNEKWDSVPVISGINLLPTGGVNGGQALQMIGINKDISKKIAQIGELKKTVRVGFWFKVSEIPLFSGEIISIGSFNEGNKFFYVSITNTGLLACGLSYFTPTANSSIYKSTTNVADGSYHYCELHWTSSSTPTALDGSIEGWIDGVSFVSQVNIDTSIFNEHVENMNEIRFHGLRNTTNGITYDDIIIWNDEVGDGFMGSLNGKVPTIATRYANGNGVQNDFTPAGAATNFEAVDENGGSDKDATTVISSTLGHKDLYDMQDYNEMPTEILAVVNNVVGRTDGGETRDISVKQHLSGSETSKTLTFVSDPIRTLQGPSALAPDGSSWTEVKVNNSEFGFQIV